MTDKVQKIREEIEKLQKRAEHNFDISLTEIERQFWLGESNVLTLIGKYIDSLQEEPVSNSMQEEPTSEFLNIESMIESYKQRLISQANGMKNNPLIDMCLASYKHGINETLDTLNLSNVQRTVKNWKEHVSEANRRKV